MSMFLCPLCGKQNSIKYYHPETFDDDVEIFHNASHGRGKPFEKILGFSLEEFPELNEKLGNRAQRVSEFLYPQPMIETRINELTKQLEEEIKKRIIAEEHLEELDLEFLLNKVKGSLGWEYTDVHTAVDELINTNRSLTSSNRFIESMNQTLESSCIKLELEKRDIESDNTRLKNENNRLKENIQKWAETHRTLESSYSKLIQMKNKLESETASIKKENIELKNIIHQWAESQNSLKSLHRTQINEHSNALIRAQNRLKQAEDSLEELDLEILLEKIRKNTQIRFTDIHAGVDELIRMYSELEDESEEVLEFINEKLPEEYDLFSDLWDAIVAFHGYFVDQIEESSGN